MRIVFISLFSLCCLALTSCTQDTQTAMHTHTNELINETSPYLLQHAHNPVNWQAWNEETLAQAKKEKKLMLISVGYSSCHWCHVMEAESFEDSTVAAVMNANFINIKVDREERPDVDNIYMNAVQLMTGQGGWPLNAIALPDGRPVWGGTYFPKEQWMDALKQISALYKEDPNQLVEYADKLASGIKALDVITVNSDTPQFSQDSIALAVQNWSRSWDTRLGGLNRAPKFMMPNNYHFLLRYAFQTDDKELKEYVETTLKQMAYGGINDQIGGGFSRYSTDTKWHIPHFEKMLYDNAQLVSLYSDAFLATDNPLYKETVYETLSFIEREMTTEEGGFYSALDADSLTEEEVLEEGAYYVWTKEELQNILGDEYPLFANYYNIKPYGLWEDGKYVLIRQDSDQDFAQENGIDLEELRTKVTRWKEIALRFRESDKTYPRLDDKILTSWNALMLKGYVDAYRVFNEASFLESALKNAEFLRDKMIRSDGGLQRNYNKGVSSINAYLEDYAATIEAFIALFEVTTDEQWLLKAKDLTDYVYVHFYNPETSLFYFTSDEDPALVSRSIEYRDNVIPASNSIMAKNLYKLSHYFFEENYTTTAAQMLNNVQSEITQYASGYSNWLDLMLNYTNPYYEIVIAGSEADTKLKELNTYYIPNKLIAATKTESNLSIFEGRLRPGTTYVYVCVNNACKLPVTQVKDAVDLIED